MERTFDTLLVVELRRLYDWLEQELTLELCRRVPRLEILVPLEIQISQTSHKLRAELLKTQ